MSFNPQFLATGIGSVPFEDPEVAVDVVLSRFPQAPYWPQLCRLGIDERMEVQFSEGLPRMVIDREKNRAWFDTSGDYSEAFAEFYEAYLAAMDPEQGSGDCSAMAISPRCSKGIYALEAALSKSNGKMPFVKVQVTGPCTFSLNVVDESKRASYYNEAFRDVVVKALAMKSRWQIQRFQPFAEKVICFIDEPILSAFGSSTYLSVKREDVVSHLNEIVQAIHADRALAGIHCCGNTEWSIPIDAGVDIVSFDAFGFGETIAIYSDAVGAYLSSGGVLAWGVVPTSGAIREQTVDTLVDHFEKTMDHLAAKGIDKRLIVDRAMITPVCGTGGMEPADAKKVFEMTAALSRAMKERYGFAS
jgi:hypothetical protein